MIDQVAGQHFRTALKINGSLFHNTVNNNKLKIIVQNNLSGPSNISTVQTHNWFTFTLISKL